MIARSQADAVAAILPLAYGRRHNHNAEKAAKEEARYIKWTTTSGKSELVMQIPYAVDHGGARAIMLFLRVSRLDKGSAWYPSTIRYEASSSIEGESIAHQGLNEETARLGK